MTDQWIDKAKEFLNKVTDHKLVYTLEEHMSLLKLLDQYEKRLKRAEEALERIEHFSELRIHDSGDSLGKLAWEAVSQKAREYLKEKEDE